MRIQLMSLKTQGNNNRINSRIYVYIEDTGKWMDLIFKGRKIKKIII